MNWNELTLPDKARMIQLAVNSSITDLRTIQEVYNTYAEGGPIEENYKFNPSSIWGVTHKRDIQVPYRAPKVTDEELVDEYINKVLWVMENPEERGYNPYTGRYKAYTDKDSSGRVHTNIGPGLEKNGHPNINYTREYPRGELDDLSRETVRNRVSRMSESLKNMQNGKYYETRDTLSLGPLLSLVDIAYNTRTSGRRNLPENWPTLIKNLAEGNLEAAKNETYSGSKRRQKMRNDLLTYNPITEETVKNR